MITRARDTFSQVSDAAKELVASMLAVDADDRMTVDEALAHRWIAERDVYAPKIHLQVKSALIFALQALQRRPGGQR